MATESPYTIGHKECALAYMRFRTAERSCGFFRPHVGPASRILDCGCGPGSITVGLARWAPDGQTIGIDIGAEQLDGARALARELGVTNVAFRQGSIFDLPFVDDSFDVVFSQTVLFHVPHPEKALAEIKRVLRPGGWSRCAAPSTHRCSSGPMTRSFVSSRAWFASERSAPAAIQTSGRSSERCCTPPGSMTCSSPWASSSPSGPRSARSISP
jgi:ubiquinone/menaquinone biosynthesis C-methylase UbiE